MADKKDKTEKIINKSTQAKKTISSEEELNKFLKQSQAKKLTKQEMMRQQHADRIKETLPSNNFTLPVIPIRQGLLFPNTESVLNFGRDFSVKAIKKAVKENKLVVLVSQKRADVDKPAAKHLYTIGTLAVIERTLKTDETLSALVRGIARVKIVEYVQFQPYLAAQISKLEEIVDEDRESDALANHLKKIFQEIVQLGKPVEFLNFIKLMSGVNQSEMADQIATTLNIKTAKKQDLLETLNVKARLKKVIKHLTHETKVLEIERDVVSKTQQKFDKHMRENILRERLKTIKKELGEYDDAGEVADTYQEKLKAIDLPELIENKLKKEIKRLASMSPNNPETGYVRTWLDTIFDMPWNISDEGEINLVKAERVLNKNHYGLTDVKNRILEYIAVLELKKEQAKANKSDKPSSKKSNKLTKTSHLPTILCFVGPPGVGKTSIGKAIAQALGRKFTKVSLGGIRDEAEIRGHRRTYIGAMPGRIIKGIIDAGTKNPIFILDEIDKVGKDFRGDPSAALLEVLDPEQNQNFEDHYLDTPFDLSEVIFITTANTLDTVPPALRDRLEIIQYSGYTFHEKFNIGKKHLLTKVFQSNGLINQKINITDGALNKVIQRYTKEAGVRELERQLGKICRKLAKKIVETKNKKATKLTVNQKTVRELLGPEQYDLSIAEKNDQVGVATGLAWTRIGGDILFIEAALTPGKGKVVLTGQLGDVMKESAQAALTFVKAHATELKIDPKRFETTDIHVHVPEGAVPKDGPSAGITMATTIASVFTKKTVRREIAMTGEITLRGRVMRIGGLKEKVIAAHLAGIKKVIIPADNERNLEDIPDQVKKEIKFIPVKETMTVLSTALN